MKLALLAVLLAAGARAEEGPRDAQPATIDAEPSKPPPTQITPNQPATQNDSNQPAAHSAEQATPVQPSPAQPPAVSSSTGTVVSSTATPQGATVAPSPFAASLSSAPPAAVAFSSAPPAAVTFSSAPPSVPLSTAAALPEELLPFGQPLDMSHGPWLIGEVLVRGNQTVSSYAILEGLRARRGALYTPSDIDGDLRHARSVPDVLSARLELYAMREEAVPPAYQSITASTMMARAVFWVEEKPSLPGLSMGMPTTVSGSTTTPRFPPAAVSGVVLTPTAYRGAGRYTSPGLGADVNAAYFIGRLYGKNSVSAHDTNYLDRIGLWFLTFDGKAQIQSEGDIRPAVAVGGQGTYMLRDAPQPSVQTVTLTVNVSQKTTKTFSGAYFVASKKIYGVRTSLGFMHGSAGEQIAYLTEFLSPQSLQFLYGKGAGVQATSKSTLFGSLMILPKPQYPLAVEFMKPNGMPLNPILLNFKLGYFLHLNFDVSYLKFQGGWDALGQFQFRYNHFPRL
ncbi:MAG TPA: hypothetical protein VNI01_01215 [Elusimicrobiota bacterium]|jgi:hypothetical protein|nr:hypothetical protein [Elusimicrobiota bacterium]